MINNSRGRGFAIWSQSADARAFQFASSLERHLDKGPRATAFLIVFGENSKDELRTLAGKHLHQLQLAVTGNPCYANNLPGMNGKLVNLNRLETRPIVGACAVDHEDRRARFAATLGGLAEYFGPDHHCRHVGVVHIRDRTAAGKPAAP